MRKTQIAPFLMFEGQAEEAMKFYMTLFPDASMESIEKYEAGEAGKAGTVKHARFKVAGQQIRCIDSPAKHDFTFTPSFSFFVECRSTAEIDSLFAELSEDGQIMMPPDNYGFSQRFCWVSDRFGVSWQLNLADKKAD